MTAENLSLNTLQNSRQKKVVDSIEARKEGQLYQNLWMIQPNFTFLKGEQKEGIFLSR